MTSYARLTISWIGLAIAAALFVGLGAAASWLAMQSRMPPATAAQSDPPAGHDPTSPPAGAVTPAPTGRAADPLGPLPDVSVTLGEDGIKRAGIVISPVMAGEATSDLLLPGVVEPNAYRQVAVTPLVAGRVTRVTAALGDRVRRGQAMAEVYSPELADAQTTYLTFVAELDAVHQQLRRAERLADIGAASRQELERIRAEHVAHTAHVEGARSRLTLLGMTPEQVRSLSSTSVVTATVHVPAPLDGIVTERLANTGANVDAATQLFTIVDLTTVWVIADLYERDFARVRVGSPATITTTAYPDMRLPGRVSYIDPQLDPATRTSKVRVELGNPGGRLRLGMFAEVRTSDARGARMALLPLKAIQTVADRHVAYLADSTVPGRFIEREVRIGRTVGDLVEVLAGVQVGDRVVTEGSFYIRAERERLGLRPAAPAGSSVSRSQTAGTIAVQTAKVIVSPQGFQTTGVRLRAGVPARVTIVRTTDETCATEVVFPAFEIKRALPLNEPVEVEFTPGEAGEIAFACAMDMLRGTIPVDSR
jgi:RND family efflux transporter MFP subunit